MVAQKTSLLNAFETTLSTTLGASGTTVTLTAVTDSASNNITAPCSSCGITLLHFLKK